jgi:uncharacterized cupredoxin-like copper-binding protein
VSSAATERDPQRRRRQHRGMTFACAVAAIAATVLAAGCSSGSSTSSNSPSASAPGTTAAAQVGATAVTATETEFHIALSTTNFSAGRYTLTAVNRGHMSHNLVINGPGVNKMQTSLLAPGQSGSVTVTLRPGTYDIYCSVPGHKSAGMDVHITVS